MEIKSKTYIFTFYDSGCDLPPDGKEFIKEAFFKYKKELQEKFTDSWMAEEVGLCSKLVETRLIYDTYVYCWEYKIKVGVYDKDDTNGIERITGFN